MPKLERRYKKVSYLYGKPHFFLYTPMDIEVVKERTNSNGKVKALTYIENGKEHDFEDSFPYEIVKSFIPSDKKMLVSDYKGKTVVAYTDHHGYFPDIKHELATVLVEKRGN